MNLYEMTYILRTDLDEDGLRAVQERVTGRMTDAGGEVVKSEGWGRRRLAYPIDKSRDGMYFTTIFRMPGDAVRTFENQLRLTPEILRFLVISQQESNVNLTGSLIPSGFSHRATPAPPAAPAETPAEGVPTGEGAAAEASPTAGETGGAETLPEGPASPATEEPAATDSAVEESAPAETAPQADSDATGARAAEPTTAEASTPPSGPQDEEASSAATTLEDAEVPRAAEAETSTTPDGPSDEEEGSAGMTTETPQRAEAEAAKTEATE
jgi:small subunit ribosomal protein S6